ncbi:MAG: tetratricopeptide repeat protein [Planctomycetota bacterium]
MRGPCRALARWTGILVLAACGAASAGDEAAKPATPAAGGMQPVQADGRVGELVAEGRSLLEKGQYKDAYAVFQEAFLEAPGEIGISFYMGQAAFGSGEYGAAVTAYERILQAQPQLHRVRLELARTYYMMGAMSQAQAEFEQVLAANPPEPVKVNVERFLQAINQADRRNFITGRLSVGYAQDSNPAVAPEEKRIDVLIGGLPAKAVLSDSTFKDHDQYSTSSAYLKHIFITPWKPLEWRTSFLWFGTWYEQRDKQNVNYYSAKTGPGASWKRFDLELLAFVNGLEKDCEVYQKSHGLELNAMFQANKNLLLGAMLRRENKKLYQDRDTDALNYTLALRPILVWGAKGENRLFTEFKYEREYPTSGAEYRGVHEANHVPSTRNDHNAKRDSFIAKAFSFRYTRDLPWFQLSPYVGWSYRQAEYSVRNPTFPAIREDDVSTWTFGITKQLPWRMSLDLSHTRTNSRSTVDLYDYQRHQTTATLSKDF